MYASFEAMIGRHRLAGFDGPLTTLGFPLVLRVLLDRSRRSMFVTWPPASRRSLFQ
jgi:hypothetical protein